MYVQTIDKLVNLDRSKMKKCVRYFGYGTGRILGGSWSTNTPYWFHIIGQYYLPIPRQLHILAVRWQIDFCTPIRYLDLTVSLQDTWASTSVLQSVQVYQFVYGIDPEMYRFHPALFQMDSYCPNPGPGLDLTGLTPKIKYTLIITKYTSSTFKVKVSRFIDV